jgi:hypothetical protein
VSVPVPSDPAGIVIVADPLESVTAAEVYPPPVRVTEPVGVPLAHAVSGVARRLKDMRRTSAHGLPLLTEIATDKLCAVVMLDEAGVTVTVGAIAVVAAVTVTVFVPVAEVKLEELFESGAYVAVSVSAPVANAPAGIVIVTLPLASVVEADV